MQEQGHIQYIKNKDIDRQKWDECIVNSGNGLVYACSFYLDSMAGSWEALVLNDYEAVMPLPCKRKMFIHYLFQPFLTPVLGLFGKKTDEALVTRFISAIPSKFLLRDISLNPSNPLNQKFRDQFHRNNYTLSLAPSYESLRNRYSENIGRNILKAERTGCLLKKDIDIGEIVTLCRQEWPRFTKIGKGVFENLASSFPVFRPYCKTYGVYHPDGKLLASCAFLLHAQRAYYWLVGNDPEAKNFGASPMLIDQFIKDYAGTGYLLDFEGSDIEGIAAFYQRFGATPENYTTLYQNLLPFPFRLFKKTPLQYLRLIS